MARLTKAQQRIEEDHYLSIAQTLGATHPHSWTEACHLMFTADSTHPGLGVRFWQLYVESAGLQDLFPYGLEETEDYTYTSPTYTIEEIQVNHS